MCFLCEGVITHWGPHVDEVMVYISGSKTDWLNQGCVRSHSRVDINSPNSDICIVRALTELHALYPAKFEKGKDNCFPTWRNGEGIQPTQVTALLRAAVASGGHNPASYSLHSLRAAGGDRIVQSYAGHRFSIEVRKMENAVHLRVPMGEPSDDDGPHRPNGYGQFLVLKSEVKNLFQEIEPFLNNTFR